MNVDKAQSQLAAYGYALTDSFQIRKGDKTFSVVVSAKGPRFYVKQMSGAPLWSGPDLGEFVKSFWFAKKVEPMVPNMSSRHLLPLGRPVNMTVEETRLYRAGHMAPMQSLRATAQARAEREGKDVSILTSDGEEVEWCTPQRSNLARNGRGIYHETAAGKHDMVLHQDHRGSWRIDLVTSATGNHQDVTGPNRGYGSAEEAFQAALDVQRTRGIRGKSHVYIADSDGNLSDYEPMEANGSSDGTEEDDYVIAILDRDANMGLYRIVRGGKWMGPLEKSANIDTIVHAMEQDARERGVHGVAVFQSDGEGTTQVGNVVNGRYQESGGYEGNGRATVVDADAARELDLYIANTWALVGDPNGPGKSIDANLKRKLASGKYDSALAPKAWQYLVDQGAKRYQKEFGSGSPIFNAATRRQVAEDFARAWEDENQLARNSSSMNNFPEVDKFIRDLDSFLGGVRFDRTIHYRLNGPAPGSLWVNFINLPPGVGSAGGGAEAENNRVSFNVRFTGETARVEQMTSALDRKYRLRAKSGAPYAIARYLSDFLRKIVAEVNPKFTHSAPR